MATDLRASASLVLAGLQAEGTTIVDRDLPRRPRLRADRGQARAARRTHRAPRALTASAPVLGRALFEHRFGLKRRAVLPHDADLDVRAGLRARDQVHRLLLREHPLAVDVREHVAGLEPGGRGGATDVSQQHGRAVDAELPAWASGKSFVSTPR